MKRKKIITNRKKKKNGLKKKHFHSFIHFLLKIQKNEVIRGKVYTVTLIEESTQSNGPPPRGSLRNSHLKVTHIYSFGDYNFQIHIIVRFENYSAK